MTSQKTHIIDAAGKSLGRTATAVALILMGKNKTNYLPYKVTGDNVVVKNIDKVKFTGKKFNQKKYYHHAKYMGSLKTEKLEELFKKDPAQLFKKCVSRMLPKNKLIKERIKNLKIE